jgi:hypothetical protein
MSDMIETNARDFSRNFSLYRSKAARGETIRIHSPDGVFLLMKEPRGLTAGAMLEKLKRSEGEGFFDVEGGGERIEEARRRTGPAQSPWER